MRTLALALTLLAGSLIPSTTYAQGSHAAPRAVLDQAIQDHAASAQADRDRVLQLMQRPEVRSLAGDLGVDLRRAESALATVDGQDLAQVTAQAQRVEGALAGGQSRISISTTALIIGLLLLIVLILALK